MRRTLPRTGAILLCLSACVLTAVGDAHAQGRRAERPDYLRLEFDGDLEAALKNQLLLLKNADQVQHAFDAAQFQSRIQQLLQDLEKDSGKFDPAAWQKQLEGLDLDGLDLNNPRIQEQLKELQPLLQQHIEKLQQQGQITIPGNFPQDPEALRQQAQGLQKLIEKFQQARGGAGPKGSNGGRPAAGDPGPDGGSGPRADAEADEPGRRDRLETPNEMGEWVQGWYEQLKDSDLVQRLQNDQAFGDLLEDLDRIMADPESFDWGGLDFGKAREWAEGFELPQWDIPVPDVSELSLGDWSWAPSVDLRPPPWVAAPAVPQVGTPGVPSLESVLVVLLGVIGAVLVVLLLQANKSWQRFLHGPEWSPGPWPVPPAQVRTQGDLIAAFEHLSLVLLGRPAANWNHLVIAERLERAAGTARPGQAHDLALLYEQARYAPPQEPLSAEVLGRAREYLVSLAGAAQP